MSFIKLRKRLKPWYCYIHIFVKLHKCSIKIYKVGQKLVKIYKLIVLGATEKNYTLQE